MSSASSSSSSSSSAPAPSAGAAASSSATSRKRARQQPRHFHAGPQPTAEEEEEKQQEEEAAGQPPAARLYRHALESIFGFLSLKELSSVLAVSRSWSSAVGSMRSVDATVESLPAGHSLVSLCASRLARHIGTLGSLGGALSLSCEGVYSLSLRLSGLHTLHYTPPDPLVLPLHFPSSLTKLDIALTGATSANIRSMIEQASRVSSLRSLTLGLEIDDEPLSFAPLVRLPHLQEIDLSNFGGVLDSEQIDELRALPHLRALKIALTEDELRELLRTPHQLHLQNLEIGLLGPETFGLFASLPSLTDLSVDGEDTVAFLRFTPNVRILKLTNLLRPESCSPERMIAELGQCEQITCLTIEHSRLTAAHLRALLSLMPALRELHLASLPRMESLSFLSSKQLQRSLTRLSLSNCCHAQLRSVEVRHIFSLHQLTHLSIDTSFTEQWDSLTQHDLQVPSERLPKLVNSEIKGMD